ncbi:MAG: tetratricopeptide repeat protein [Woeseiaceae bacterium]
MQQALREGLTLLSRGKVEEASQCARRVIGAKRDLPEAHFLVGLIALELEEKWTAIQAFGSVTELQPDNGASWAHLAKLFLSIGQAERADDALDKAMRFENDSAIVQATSRKR